ncbi:MAG TPA: ribosome biogenesis GTPase Der, partial [Actinomycetota bacterium]|nr:ribosome biogenesis GTPase Der [Actinomycetota bacterium]
MGKSTLVNRLFGSREAIAHEMPGVTRDRVELEATWGGRTLKLIDTGGFAHDPKGIEALVSDQAERAAREADVVLLVVDVQTGPVEEDSALARRLRRADVPVLVVVNKVDTERDESEVPAFLSLGLGDPVPVSALHGRGSGDLLDQLVAVLPDEEAEEVEEPEEPRFAIVGRPNVGKSSLFNRLVGEERSVVYEEAGTTRDAVDALVTWPDGPVRFVDTAGLRRPSKVQGIEYYSFLRAERAIERADVALLVLDASQGFTGEDKRIAARVMAVGRGLVVVANKWDLIEERDRSFKELTELLSPYARAPVLRTSAIGGTGVHRLPAVLSQVHERWMSR